MLFMTIPTAGARPELLRNLIRDCGLPLDRVVIVRTRPGVALPEGVVCIDDFESPNIQRWWTLGICKAVELGASAVAVLNDDVRVSPETLPSLHSKLLETKAAIASPRRPEFPLGLHKGWLIPYEPRLWGSLWVLRVDSGLMPDQRYVWWYGDNDLDIRARRDSGGVVLVDVEYEHMHPSEGTSADPNLVAQTEVDAQTFELQYAHLLRMSRALLRWKHRLGLGGA